MQYITLKGTNDLVSRIAMGTDIFHSEEEIRQRKSFFDIYTDMGGNIIDTALIYGGEDEHLSEKLIGKWLREKKNRNSLFISTKGGHPKINTMHISRLSGEEIEGDINTSLKNLGTDHVDIYWLHRDDENKPVEEIMETMNGLVKKGKTRYIGMSNWTAKRIDEANKYAKEHGMAQIISSQIQYSAARAVVENNDQTLVLMNDTEYEYYKNNDMSVFAFAPQAKGFFHRLASGGIENLSEKARHRYFCKENLEIFKRAEKLAKEKNITVGQAALAALISNTDFQTIAIVGASKKEQLLESLMTADMVFSQNEADFVLGRNRSKRVNGTNG